MNKERILEEAQEIASNYSFWMVSGNISHLYGYILEVADTKYELEIKFGDDFPESPPKLNCYEAIRKLLGDFDLFTLKNWSIETRVIKVLDELKKLIEEKLGMEEKLELNQEEAQAFSESSEDPSLEEDFLPSEANKQENLVQSEGEYITPDLNAYPPDFEVDEYIASPSTETGGEESDFEESIDIESPTSTEETSYSSEEILDVDQSSVLINTEIGLIQQEYAYDHVGNTPGSIIVYLTITISKTFMINIDLSPYPEKPRLDFPEGVQNLLGNPDTVLDTLKNWKKSENPHVIDVLHELERKLFFIKDIEAESKKIQGEYQCESISSDPTKLKIHLVTYGFKEYPVEMDIGEYPKRPILTLSPELKQIISVPIEELKAYREWKEKESESVEILREIAWLVDKNSRINFEIELLKEHYENITYDSQTQLLKVHMKGKMKSQDLTFEFEINLPNEYPMKVPEIKVVNEFELESHEKIKNDLQLSFKSFFDDWTPFKYLVDLFNAVSKKIFEVSVVSCVICHKIECPTCSKKIAGPDQESCHVECLYCERPYHDHCWAQTIRSFGKCGFCLKTPPPNMMPN